MYTNNNTNEIMTFGKYKGKSFEDLFRDNSYLNYVLGLTET
jgi:hypothetical protein